MEKLPMNKLAISVLAGATALFATAASAAPVSAQLQVAPDSNILNVRTVCNENGRCWRERDRDDRVIIRERDSYGYAPRERYERREYNEDRGPGFGFRTPGVDVEVGRGDRY